MTIDGFKTGIRAAWDHGAESYDSRWSHGIKTAAERRAWTGLLRRLLPPDEPLRVLDVGCGPGVITLLAAELGHKVTGLDLSPRMLDVAGRRAAERGLEIELVEGDAESPQLPAGSYDAVISRHVLWTLPEPERAVRAWARLSRPGGQIVAIDGLWTPGNLAERALVLAGTALERLRPDDLDGDHAYPEGTRELLPLLNARSLDPARNAFVRAGLSAVHAEELTWLDRVERAQFPLAVRLRSQWRRYLVAGTVPGSGQT